MIAKLVVWGSTREQAIARTLRALHEYRLPGLTTNLELLQHVLRLETFASVTHDTRFVERDVMPAFGKA